MMSPVHGPRPDPGAGCARPIIELGYSQCGSGLQPRVDSRHSRYSGLLFGPSGLHQGRFREILTELGCLSPHETWRDGLTEKRFHGWPVCRSFKAPGTRSSLVRNRDLGITSSNRFALLALYRAHPTLLSLKVSLFYPMLRL